MTSLLCPFTSLVPLDRHLPSIAKYWWPPYPSFPMSSESHISTYLACVPYPNPGCCDCLGFWEAQACRQVPGYRLCGWVCVCLWTPHPHPRTSPTHQWQTHGSSFLEVVKWQILRQILLPTAP